MASEATYHIDDLCFIDFETASAAVNLKTHGPYAYACAADAVILAYAIGEAEPATVAVPRFPGALDWRQMPAELRDFRARVLAGTGRFAAWNAAFDKAIWNYATDGFPGMEPFHIIDVMAQAAAAGLPPDLAKASQMAGGVRKLDTGKDLIKLFCLPGATATPASHPVEWIEFQAYAAVDISSMRNVFKRTRQLSIEEWQEYWAMEAVNERGARIDLDLAHNAAILAAEDKRHSARALSLLTNGAVSGVDQVKRMVEWLLASLPLAGRAVLTTRVEEQDDDGEITRPAKYSLTRPRVEKLMAYITAQLDAAAPAALIDPELLQRALTLLQLRYYGGSKTPAKFAKAALQAVDGRLYGQYVFNGAGQTGRASSRGVQVHNLARDCLPYETAAIDAVLAGCSHGALAQLGDDTPVARKLALLIRPLFVAGSGNMLVWSDWSQIEARILPWVAGESAGAKARLDIFRQVDADPSLPDLYTRTAAVLSHCDVTAVTKAMRQRGKVAELALGYGGGLGALQAMGAGYGLYVEEREGREIVSRWREANGWCVGFWGRHGLDGSYGLWGAANQALDHPHTPFRTGRVTYVFLPQYLGGSLICVLPSGRLITYRACRYERVPVLDDDDNVVDYETVMRFARGYGRVKLWHGMLCENIVQAIAADCLRGTLARLEEMGAPVVLHTHDEVLLEVDEASAAGWTLQLREIMQQGFRWSDDLPLMSEETASYYYSKSESAHASFEGLLRLQGIVPEVAT